MAAAEVVDTVVECWFLVKEGHFFMTDLSFVSFPNLAIREKYKSLIFEQYWRFFLAKNKTNIGGF